MEQPQERIYVVREKKYYMPELSWQQLRRITAFLESMDLSISPKDNINMMALILISRLMKKDAGPLFLSLLLVPEGEEWKPMMAWRAKKVFGRVSEKTIVSAVTDFFAGRESLIMEFMPSLTKLIASLVMSISGSKKNAPASSSPAPSPSTGPTATTGQPSSSEPPTGASKE
jgi:hypothetical protein